MIFNAEREALVQTARDMALAARTAPKACGKDHLVIAILEEGDRGAVVAEMDKIAAEIGSATFARDARNLEAAPVTVLVGSRLARMGLKYCGLCGHANCAANQQAGGMCVYNPHDLGLAVGSAAATAAARHADCRVMYTVGMAVLRLKLLGEDVRLAFGLPLSATGKNPFFDRK